jgi:hypothetical protein
MVLLNGNLNPVSECFLFSNHEKINILETTTDKNQYNSREKVSLEIKNHSNFLSEISNLSLSVIHTNALENGRKSRNILTHFLLNSELNNFYENSTDFFINDGISSEAKLRLLMLTSGWGDYLWNSIPGNTENLSYMQTAGLNISGIAKNALTEKPLDNADITLVIQKDGEMAFLNQQTNEYGVFTFPGLLYNDSAKVSVQAKNEKGRMNTSISLFQPFSEKEINSDVIHILSENTYSPQELKELKYKSATNKNSTAKRRLKRLRKKETPETDKHFKLYDEADYVLTIENNESFDNILDYMVGKVPGLDISAKQVRIRGTSGFGASGAPLFLLDGVPVNQQKSFEFPDINRLIGESENNGNDPDDEVVQSIRSIPINDVEKIEVLKSPQNLAVFGVRGANGVIAIYTHKGETDGSRREARGILEDRIMGYTNYKKMFLPNYALQNNPENKDYRITLFWEPEITIENEKVLLSFFTSDQSGLYKIFVEGITDNGNICIGESEFEVN